MHHKLLSARLMQQKTGLNDRSSPASRTSNSSSLDEEESDDGTTPQTVRTTNSNTRPEGRAGEHAPLKSGLLQIVSHELGCRDREPEPDPAPPQLDQLRELQEQQHLQHLQEIAQQNTENAIVAMMANRAATTLGYPPTRMSPAVAMAAMASVATPSPPLINRSAADQASSIASLHLHQLLLQQQHLQQHPLHHSMQYPMQNPFIQQQLEQLEQLRQQQQQQQESLHRTPQENLQQEDSGKARQRPSDESDPGSEKKKRRREQEDGSDDMGDEDDDDPEHRFRPYQSDQWQEKFKELCDFRKAKGHCQVPHTYAENPPLARWVKRQRYQYKLKIDGRNSTMTDERIVALEDIGFIWDSHFAAWHEKMEELKEYCKAFGNCNVPSTYPENPQLATWVKCQRRQYKLLKDGKTSNMSLGRIEKLEKIGFIWEMRKN